MARFEPRTRWGRDLAERGAEFDKRMSSAIDAAPPWAVSLFGLLGGVWGLLGHLWLPVKLVFVAATAMCATALVRDLLARGRKADRPDK